YTYCDCGRLTQATLPDGQAVGLGYDSAGRLSTVTLPSGQVGYSYDPATGRLTSATAPGGVGTSFAYDGGLLAGTSWTGPVAGAAPGRPHSTRRTASLSVNGGSPIPFGYDADGLLTRAGDLTLTRDPQNGLLTGTTLGSVTDTVTYDGFGEPTRYRASQGGT